MKYLASALTLRVVLLPLVGVCGTIFVLLFPEFHATFCGLGKGIV